jgi:hypothetical protein
LNKTEPSIFLVYLLLPGGKSHQEYCLLLSPLAACRRHQQPGSDKIAITIAADDLNEGDGVATRSTGSNRQTAGCSTLLAATTVLLSLLSLLERYRVQ